MTHPRKSKDEEYQEENMDMEDPGLDNVEKDEDSDIFDDEDM